VLLAPPPPGVGGAGHLSHLCSDLERIPCLVRSRPFVHRIPAPWYIQATIQTPNPMGTRGRRLRRHVTVVAHWHLALWQQPGSE
jgi:hypothetical protein